MSLSRPGETTEQWNKRRLAEFLADKPTVVYIARNGCWSYDLANGAKGQAYERLDYHTGCRAFLESVRDAGIPFVNYSDLPFDGAHPPGWTPV